MKTESESRTHLARWTSKLAGTRALSLRQPWAWLVVNGYKDIENRSWRTKHRGPLLIHASSTTTDFKLEHLEKIDKKYGVRVPVTVDIGGIVGVVDVVDCVPRHRSKWHFQGNWAWVLENPRRLPFRECKATVGFFHPDIEEEPEEKFEEALGTSDYVVYHNADQRGSAMDVTVKAIVTSKSIKNVLGSRIWLITGEDRPKKYFLRGWFRADKVKPTNYDGFAHRVSGKEGPWFKKLMPIGSEEWFPDLRHSQGNFGLGMQPITDQRFVRGLERIAKKAPK